MRNEGTGVFDAVGEAIRVGEQSGVPVDIIHLKIADQSLWGRMPAIVALIEQARRRGVNVQANVYPYTRGNNDLVSIDTMDRACVFKALPCRRRTTKAMHATVQQYRHSAPVQLQNIRYNHILGNLSHNPFLLNCMSC
jgi:N-acyl-D-aspartate/D-glutamate deacylase